MRPTFKDLSVESLFIISIVCIGLIVGLMVTVMAGEKESKMLRYKYNDRVTIVISNLPCTLPEHSQRFPYAALALRDDGEQLNGCFRGENEYVIIQWDKGDTTKLDANVFLLKPQV